jgi:SAM-dependent methyltransferase
MSPSVHPPDQVLPENRAHIVERLAPGNVFQPATVLWRVYEIEAVQRHVRFGGQVLDLGCGDGSLSRVVFETSDGLGGVVGVEPDQHDATQARQSGVYARVHNTTGDSVPEGDGRFDVVFSNSTLEHIPEIEPVLREVGRLLRPGGRFVFTVPSEQFHSCLKGGALPAVLARLHGETIPQTIDRRLQHKRYWSPAQWSGALGPHGMVVRETHRYFPRRAVQDWQTLSSWTGGIAYELFGRRDQTRAVQRRLRLPAVESLIPSPLRARILHQMVGSGLSAQDAAGGQEPSGGLLVIADRVGPKS